MFMCCGVILIVRVFFYITYNNDNNAHLRFNTTTLLVAFFVRSPANARAWAESNIGMASLFGQSARSGRLTRPVSDSAPSPLRTWPEVRR